MKTTINVLANVECDLVNGASTCAKYKLYGLLLFLEGVSDVVEDLWREAIHPATYSRGDERLGFLYVMGNLCGVKEVKEGLGVKGRIVRGLGGVGGYQVGVLLWRDWVA